MLNIIVCGPLAGFIAFFLLACVPSRGGWSLEELPGPVRARMTEKSRLTDLSPQPWVAGADLVQFLCRWRTEQPVPVVFPEDASAEENRMLRAVLQAWSQAGLGIRFLETAVSSSGINIKFVSKGDSVAVPQGAGDALADCRVALVPVRNGQLEASLEFASVYLRRDQEDWLGRSQPIGWDERYGTALHELGHALGFSSHVARGHSVMSKSPAVVRKAGAAVRAGSWSGDPNLRALYAVPTGMVVARRTLQVSYAQEIEAFLRRGQRLGLRGPYTRVGDQGARLIYRGASGESFVAGLRPWPPPQEAADLRLVFNDRAKRRLVGAAGLQE